MPTQRAFGLGLRAEIDPTSCPYCWVNSRCWFISSRATHRPVGATARRRYLADERASAREATTRDGVPVYAHGMTSVDVKYREIRRNDPETKALGRKIFVTQVLA